MPPAAESLENVHVSVPVQSYRRAGSQALCLVAPWECPLSVQLSEKHNSGPIGRTTNRRSSQQWDDSRTDCSDDEKNSCNSRPNGVQLHIEIKLRVHKEIRKRERGEELRKCKREGEKYEGDKD